MRSRTFAAAVAIAAAASVTAGLPTPRPAAAVPSGFSDSLVQGSFVAPTALQVLPGGRVLVLEKGGRVQLLRPDGSLGTALTVPVCTDSEMGLLSVAIDPSFDSNGFVYLYRTRPGAGGSCATND